MVIELFNTEQSYVESLQTIVTVSTTTATISNCYIEAMQPECRENNHGDYDLSICLSTEILESAEGRGQPEGDCRHANRGRDLLYGALNSWHPRTLPGRAAQTAGRVGQ